MRILKYPNPFLDIPTEPITTLTRAIHKDIQRCVETLQQTDNAIALAANQIGSPWSFFSAYGSDNNIFTAINPKILTIEEDSIETVVEGCLSYRGNLLIPRYNLLCVEYRDFVTDSVTATTVFGVLAQIFQHEMEHLSGSNFTENVSEKIRSKYLKRQ